MATEKRLIDANEPIAAFKRHAKEHPNAAWSAFGIEEVLNACYTVYAVEVVHSTWSFNKDGSGTCQNCHRTTKNAWDYDSWMRYCPNCGAKMDGDKHE